MPITEPQTITAYPKEEDFQVPRVKVKKFNQVPVVSIPKKFASKVGLKEGDFLDFEIKGNSITFTKEEEEEDDAFLSSPKWREMEKEADKAIAEGRVSRIFDTAEEAIKALRSGKL